MDGKGADSKLESKSPRMGEGVVRCKFGNVDNQCLKEGREKGVDIDFKLGVGVIRAKGEYDREGLKVVIINGSRHWKDCGGSEGGGWGGGVRLGDGLKEA